MFKGSFPALVTPFKNGELDLDTLKKLIDWHVEQGSDGVVPVGTTGESPTLSHEEHNRVIEEVVKASAGRLKVIAGAGSNSTAAVRLPGGGLRATSLTPASLRQVFWPRVLNWAASGTPRAAA